MVVSDNYNTEAAKQAFSTNYYVIIEGVATNFSRQAVSGLVAAQEPHISAFSFNPSKLSLDNPKISIATMSVGLIDPAGTILAAIGAGTLHGKKITLRRGFTNLDVADYNDVIIMEIFDYSSADGVNINIKAKDKNNKIRKPINFVSSILTTDITDSFTTELAVEDTSGFPSSGTVFVENEIITYASKDSDSLNTLTRSANNPNEHKAGAPVLQHNILTENPITIMLQMMISPGGGGIYDVLSFGLGIAQTEFDLTSFESVRDDSVLASHQYRFEFTDNIEDAMAFFEREIFQFTNTRLFINSDGLIACALLQEVTIENLGGTLAEAEVERLPSVRTNSERLKNQINIKSNLNAETGKFEVEDVVDETETGSQASFGVLPLRPLISKGIRSDLDGEAIVATFAKRYFRRNAQPESRVTKVQALWSKQFFEPGQKVRFTHPDILDLITGIKGFDNRLIEVISVSHDFEGAFTVYEINNSPFLANKFGFITPSSPLLSGTSTTVFTLISGDGARGEWVTGQVVALWFRNNTAAGVQATGTILSVVGDVVTMTASLGFTPNNTYILQYADQDEVTDAQLVFSYLSQGAGNFPDGSGPYVIS